MKSILPFRTRMAIVPFVCHGNWRGKIYNPTYLGSPSRASATAMHNRCTRVFVVARVNESRAPETLNGDSRGFVQPGTLLLQNLPLGVTALVCFVIRNVFVEVFHSAGGIDGKDFARLAHFAHVYSCKLFFFFFLSKKEIERRGGSLVCGREGNGGNKNANRARNFAWAVTTMHAKFN